ncbi:hypothetical protein KJ641_00165 [Patescibacteria group bacterium]|nr:hypothetical protein [Patescibacteria group bacterium]MBU1895273.1 hypothetical protein [Patescibacteria group bacterium]
MKKFVLVLGFILVGVLLLNWLTGIPFYAMRFFTAEEYSNLSYTRCNPEEECRLQLSEKFIFSAEKSRDNFGLMGRYYGNLTGATFTYKSGESYDQEYISDTGKKINVISVIGYSLDNQFIEASFLEKYKQGLAVFPVYEAIKSGSTTFVETYGDMSGRSNEKITTIIIE